MLGSLPKTTRTALIAELTEAEADALIHDWGFWARPKQLAPVGPWLTWLILAGRGFGKTRSGAEWVRAQMCGTTPLGAGLISHIALVGETAADTRRVMVEGAESGLLAVHPRDFRPSYVPTQRSVTWPNGAKATLYNATEPDQLRGPQHGGAWCDELAKWRHARDSWDNLQFGLRLGTDPRQVVTTTPKPIALLKEILAAPNTVVTRGSTYENRANLPAKLFTDIVAKYEGTRLGRQELDAELLDEAEGALWTRDLIEAARSKVADAPDMARIVIGVDPAVTSNEQSDETGIIIAGLGRDGHGYVLEDLSGRYTPGKISRMVCDAFHTWSADRIIGEVNNGGDWIEHAIRQVDRRVAYKAIRASRGKAARAEPIAALYEQKRVHHLGGFADLEDQLCAWEPLGGGRSPDRLDALVWALTELMLIGGERKMVKLKGL